ncbi:MAG: transposase [Synergistaceae bacterium]|jgi:transposase|nr:transposase [Synergistaceae bacterium]
MHIVENKAIRAGKIYCYACECLWDSSLKKYLKPSTAVGRLEGNPPSFVPNDYLTSLLLTHSNDPSSLDERSKRIIETVIAKYGVGVYDRIRAPKDKTGVNSAQAVFIGPALVLGGITRKYRIDNMLCKAFGNNTADEILALAWYIASEGDALSNSDSWLEHFENPAGCSMSSQDITRLLDSMHYDSIMFFYKQWLAAFKKVGDKVLYDLTSISYYGHGINLAAWGHNRDNEALPQVNYALLCLRSTAMPLFAWTLDGSISDVATLTNTLQFLDKLGYKPDCLLMDRGFAAEENITYMLRRKQTFLQALRVNPDWVKRVIDAGRDERLLPESKIKVENRTYYASTTQCRWVRQIRTREKGKSVEEVKVIPQRGAYVSTEENVEVLEQYGCTVHVLFCQDLIGNHWDRFMDEIGAERQRLEADNEAQPKKEYRNYFIISKVKYARRRLVEYNLEKIKQHRNNYAGHICFITNDRTIGTASDALREYSTRDYIEKDFDEMKNDLDMGRIRVHTDGRMAARLFVQFIAEIFMREIRVCMNGSDDCKKLTRSQVFNHIKAIYKVKFKGKYKDIYPALSKTQRSILKALGIRAPG